MIMRRRVGRMTANGFTSPQYALERTKFRSCLRKEAPRFKSPRLAGSGRPKVGTENLSTTFVIKPFGDATSVMKRRAA